MLNEDPPNQMIDALARKNVIAVVGAGFTSATCPGSSAASWPSLVREGMTQIASRHEGLQGHLKRVEMFLEEAEQSGDTHDLLMAAQTVRNDFYTYEDEQSFANYLSDTFSDLRPSNPDLGKAIKNLDVPVATTNYDTLLEHALGTDSSITWDNRTDMLRVLRHDKTGVAHLHGVWTHPKSVVFSIEDYTRLTANKDAVFGETTSMASRHFLFIGMGEGVLDPNFTELMRILKDRTGHSNHYHWLLCRESELESMQAKLATTTIRPVSYGSDFDDLPAYLKLVRHSAESQASSHGRPLNFRTAGWNTIAQQIKANRLSTADEIESHDILDAIVDPTLLPLSHEQYVYEKQKRKSKSGDANDKDLEPVSAEKVLGGKRITIVVGEEHAGLTTALQWLCLKYVQPREEVTPLMVNVQEQKASERLGEILRDKLSGYGASLRRGDELPQIVVAVDNLTYREGAKFSRFITDIAASTAEKLFLGCNLGNETDLARLIQENGEDCQIVYLGKVGLSEAKKYAVIVSPDVNPALIKRVMVLIRREHLPRNPFTVLMVIALLIQELSRPERWQNQTDVLNDYMQLLLSHANRGLDARETLSNENLERVLTALAKEFVKERTGSLSEDRCTEILVGLFTELDWDESATAWLEEMTSRRILRREIHQIEFRQSSYLYLYAAKAAVQDANFMSLLLEEPLFFGPILKHCAAILRNDANLIRRTSELLLTWDQHDRVGANFDEVKRIEAPRIAESDTDLQDAEEIDEHHVDESSEAATSNEEDTQSNNPNNYDLSIDSDVKPFPLLELDKIPESYRLFMAVDLASSVLRDSDAVTDHTAKDAALLQAFHAWGVLIDHVETDEEVQRIGKRIIAEGVKQGFYSAEFGDGLLPYYQRNYASLFVLSGINASLRSSKLRKSMERLYSSNAITSKGPYATASAAFFEITSAKGEWAKNVQHLSKSLDRRLIAVEFLGSLLPLIYVFNELTANQRDTIKQTMVQQWDAAMNFSDPRSRQRFIDHNFNRWDRLRRRTVAARSLSRARALPR